MFFLANKRFQLLHLLIRRQFSSSSISIPKKTCLYDFHVANGGRMVEFAGFSLPVQYTEGLSTSHCHVRSHCGIFDVSHMLQTEIRGKDRVAFLESLCVADVKGLPDNGATLTVFTTSSGGIIDDLVITRSPLGYLYLVSNAARRDVVMKLLATQQALWSSQGLDVAVKHAAVEDIALLAIQGPSAVIALQPLVDVDLKQLRFMSATMAEIDGHPRCKITRCGYTGEDGFEICVPSTIAVPVCEQLLALKEAKAQLAGLGVRDSLRTEAGLCLYGNEITEKTTPVEAGLAWLVAKRRRETADFPGADKILEQLKVGINRKRIGLRSQGPPARTGATILCEEGKEVGQVTSGCPSPSLGGNVAMGYVQTHVAKIGTKLQLHVRNMYIDAEVTKMPFIKTNYYTMGKK